ncbi:uncharacterized protein [Aristolochia californica]|uniref:uncharacterized protein n=1 Tax=Aristolochia californica TaxID=171875 RepID=UPI0035DEC1DE
MAAPVCSIQTHHGLQAPSLITGSGMKPFQVSKTIGFRSPSHIQRGNGPSLPRPTRSLIVKNQQSSGGGNELSFTNPTTPVATYKRLFKEEDFLNQPLRVSLIDNRMYLSQVPQIRKIAVQLIKSGKLDEAERMLRVWCDFSEDKYPLQTLLVETLIYQGRYEEANKLCAVGEVGPSDARPLLKAVAYAMLSEDLDEEVKRYKSLSEEYKKEGNKWWETFSKHLTVDEDLYSALGEEPNLDKLPVYAVALNKRIKDYIEKKNADKIKSTRNP